MRLLRHQGLHGFWRGLAPVTEVKPGTQGSWLLTQESIPPHTFLQMDPAANPKAYRSQADNKRERSERELGEQGSFGFSREVRNQTYMGNLPAIKCLFNIYMFFFFRKNKCGQIKHARWPVHRLPACNLRNRSSEIKEAFIIDDKCTVSSFCSFVNGIPCSSLAFLLQKDFLGTVIGRGCWHPSLPPPALPQTLSNR